VSNHLTTRQSRFIAALQMGIDGTSAAIAAGYSRKSARYTAYDLQNCNAQVMAELARVREEFAEKAAYNAAACMAELDDAIAFAKANKQANALVKAVELRARLAGLLVQKIDLNIENRVNITGALAEAKARTARPMCDPAPAIEGEFVALPGIEAKGTSDCESRAEPYDSKVDLNL
jgi:phage terminase small subunit